MFFMGLFTPFVGAKANVPAIRFGRLSVLTDEKITAVMEDGPQYYYLMEAQVFGGNSGSPALFYLLLPGCECLYERKLRERRRGDAGLPLVVFPWCHVQRP